MLVLCIGGLKPFSLMVYPRKRAEHEGWLGTQINMEQQCLNRSKGDGFFSVSDGNGHLIGQASQEHCDLSVLKRKDESFNWY